MFRRTIQFVAVCSVVLVLFTLSVGTTFAAPISKKSTPTTQQTVHTATMKLTDPKKSSNGPAPNVSQNIGSYCVAQVQARASYGTITGSTTVTCNGLVTGIETQNEFQYCTAATSGSTYCLPWGVWQIKYYGSYCLNGGTSSQACPPGYDDGEYVGTNALYAFVGAVCVTFPSGGTDCGTPYVPYWMS